MHAAHADLEARIAAHAGVVRASARRVFGESSEVAAVVATFDRSVIVTSGDNRCARVIVEGGSVLRVEPLTNPRDLIESYASALILGHESPEYPLRMLEDALASVDARPDHVVRLEAVHHLRGMASQPWFVFLHGAGGRALSEGVDESSRYAALPELPVLSSVLSEAEELMYRPLFRDRLSTAARGFDTFRSDVCRALGGTTPASVCESVGVRAPGVVEAIQDYAAHMNTLTSTLTRASRSALSARALAEVYNLAVGCSRPAAVFSNFVQQALRPQD